MTWQIIMWIWSGMILGAIADAGGALVLTF